MSLTLEQVYIWCLQETLSLIILIEHRFSYVFSFPIHQMLTLVLTLQFGFQQLTSLRSFQKLENLSSTDPPSTLLLRCLLSVTYATSLRVWVV